MTTTTITTAGKTARHLIVATALSFALAAPAAAYSKREIADAAYHWGRVDLASEVCPRLGRNETIRGEVGTALEKADKAGWTGGYDLGRAEAQDFLEGSGQAAFCELSWAFYGRNGQTVKNLLIRKKRRCLGLMARRATWDDPDTISRGGPFRRRRPFGAACRVGAVRLSRRHDPVRR